MEINMNPENLKNQQSALARTDNSACPLLIADGIHVLNQKVYKAICSQDRNALARLLQKQVEAGAQALAVNLGPGREMGQKAPWVIDILRRMTDLPLFVSANILDHPEVLRAHGQYVAINAVTANHEDLHKALMAAEQSGCSVVVLLVQSGKMTATINDKITLALEVLDKAAAIGFPLSRLYLDPVLTYRPDPAAWHISRGMPDVGSAAETISLIKQLDGQVKTIVALGNSTGVVTMEKKSGCHSRILTLLTAAGVDAVLLNCLDKAVMTTAAGINEARHYSWANDGSLSCFSSAA